MDLSPASRRLAVDESKSSCRMSRAITIAMVSQGSRPGVIAVQSRLHRYRTSAKICMTGLSYTFGLFIWG